MHIFWCRLSGPLTRMKGFSEFTEKAADVRRGNEQYGGRHRRGVAKSVLDIAGYADGLSRLCGQPNAGITAALQNFQLSVEHKEYFRISMTVQRNGNTGGHNTPHECKGSGSL